MNFTKDEARTKIGRRVRLCDDSLSSDGIARGKTGKVVDAQLQGKVGIGTGAVSTTGQEEEIWAVSVRFDGHHDQPEILVGKDNYESSLEEI